MCIKRGNKVLFPSDIKSSVDSQHKANSRSMFKFVPLTVFLAAISSGSFYRLEDGSEPVSINDGQMSMNERLFPTDGTTEGKSLTEQEPTSVAPSDSSTTTEATTGQNEVTSSSANTGTTSESNPTTTMASDTGSESSGPSNGHEVEITHSSTAKPSGIDDEEPKPDNLTEILGSMSNDSDTVVSEITNPTSGAGDSGMILSDNKKCDKNLEYVANPNDCRTYYKCVGEEAILMNCPNGLFWTPSDNSCTADGFLSCGLHDNTNVTTSSAENLNKPQLSGQKQFYDACHQICMTNSKLKGEQDITNQPDYELSYYVCKCMNHAHPTA